MLRLNHWLTFGVKCDIIDLSKERGNEYVLLVHFCGRLARMHSWLRSFGNASYDTQARQAGIQDTCVSWRLRPLHNLDVLRLKYFHLGIDFFGSVCYTMVTRSGCEWRTSA